MALTDNSKQRITFYILLVVFSLLYWFIDSLWSYLSFEQNLRTLMYSEPGSLVDTLMLRVSPYQFISRIIVICLFLTAGIVLFETLMSKNKVKAAYRETEAAASALIRMAGQPIIVSQNRIVKFANPKAFEFSGFSSEEMIGQPSTRFIHDDDQEFMQSFATRQMMSDAATNECTIRIKRKNNEVLWTRLNATLIQWENKPATLVILTDISEEKKLAEQFKRTERMETIAMLTGGVAHDLNNIFSGLVSYPDVLLMDLPADSPLKEPLQAMKQSGQRGAMIVQDMLTLARRNVPVMQVIQINTLVNEYRESPECRELQRNHPEIRIEVDLESELLNTQGSAVQLSKALMNLVTNAVEACPRKGIISIRTYNQYIYKPILGYEVIEEGNYAVLQVEDNGHGISAEDLPHIFEPFYSRKIMGKSGTGLGMAIIWGTVKDHNGYIDVHSVPNTGTTISLYFPITREAFIQVPRESMHMIKGAGEHILIIDDLKEQREIASLMLSRLGYVPHTVANGEEAVSFLLRTSVDLALIDMIMDPGMDGLQTYRELLKINPGLKTVIVSGYAETQRVREMQRLGAGPYLKKPYTMADLGNVLKKELAN